MYTHPALSTDGSMMIFSSNKQGAGGFDLCFLTRKSGDKWSDPENLGNVINTKSNEMFPALDSANNLYFSSDGHPGFGGYDIFVCRFTGKGWEEPYNLTRVINSPGDEIAFTIDNHKGRHAFFTSASKTNSSQKQLFKITFSDISAPDTPEYLSEALQKIAYSDLTFPHKKLVAEIDTPEAKKEEIKEPDEEAVVVSIP